MELNEFEQYTTTLDKTDRSMIDSRVAEKGIEAYLTQQLVYLDCSRVINGMRMMQTIGYPYQREISSYLYALSGLADDPEYEELWYQKLRNRHAENLKYEEINPPIWYGGKKAKDKWDKDHKSDKPARRKKVKEGTIPGMGVEISANERLKRLVAQVGPLKFTIKPKK